MRRNLLDCSKQSIHIAPYIVDVFRSRSNGQFLFSYDDKDGTSRVPGISQNQPIASPRSHRPPQGSNGITRSQKSLVQAKPLSTRDFYSDVPGVESSDGYVPGGYHPVHIGDIYHERFRVIHKLGYGTYSTVWLAHDMFSTERT